MLGSPNIAARVSRPTLHLTLPLAGCGRRLVEEEGSSSKKTWLRKKEDEVSLGELQLWAPVYYSQNTSLFEYFWVKWLRLLIISDVT